MLTIKRTLEFDAWFSGIRDGMTKRRLVARLRKAQLGKIGDVKTVGEGVLGGDKSTQAVDIAKAVKIAAMIEE